MLFSVIGDGVILESYAMPNHDDTRHLPGQVETYTVVTEDISLTKAHRDVRVHAADSDITVTLPKSLPSNEVGRIYTIRKGDSSSNIVTINPGSARTINGQSTLVITKRHDSYTLLSGTGTWYIIGSHLRKESSKITTVSAATTLNDSHGTVLVDAIGGARTITLPPVATSEYMIYTIKKIDVSGNAVTIDGNGTEIIEGVTTQTLAAQWDKLRIQCDGTAWFII